VSAPHKTLLQSDRIRSTQAAEAAKSAAATQAQAALPFNAFLLLSPRFGLTGEEIESALAPIFSANASLAFTISFLPSDEVVIRAASKSFATVITPSALEATLSGIKPSITSKIQQEGLGGSIALCHADRELNIVRRGRGIGGPASTGAWSAVVGRAAQKAAVKPGTPSSAEPKVASSFVGLKKKKPVDES
jgi:transcriptional repressor NF-X1